MKTDSTQKFPSAYFLQFFDLFIVMLLILCRVVSCCLRLGGFCQALLIVVWFAAKQWLIWVHSSVVRAADCRSAGPWLKSGCALFARIVFVCSRMCLISMSQHAKKEPQLTNAILFWFKFHNMLAHSSFLLFMPISLLANCASTACEFLHTPNLVALRNQAFYKSAVRQAHEIKPA